MTESMGRTYNSRILAASELSRLSAPIILCIDRPDFDKVIADAGYQVVSLNLSLARLLAGLAPSDIQSVIGDRICELLPQTKPVYLTDYEMLFDPRYELDVLRLFVGLSRRNKLIVKWCGDVDGDTIVYAEQGFEDYKRIKVSDYDVTVVI
jgi:hypothetical protein